MARSKRNKRAEQGRPLEIPMTDLGWTEEAEERSPSQDSHSAGTPGGGTALGGLAGTNVGHGDPDDVDLENAFGSGIRDDEADRAPAAGERPGTQRP